MKQLFAYGLGILRQDALGTLDVWFALVGCHDGETDRETDRETALEQVLLKQRKSVVTPISQAMGAEIEAALGSRADTLAPLLRAQDQGQGQGQGQGQSFNTPVAVTLLKDDAIEDIEAAYLKLHLISARLKVPNSLNLDGLFATLPTLAWTNLGPLRPHDVPAANMRERLQGRSLHVRLVDKIPPLTDYLVPSGVRIGDASRIRLGAYLGDGTTVMHEGFVNFNAGALGPNMVEGRISQGVVVGAHSDLGGSASTMGTLAGGGKVRVSIGAECLIGANAGTGISLGDRCTIEAGLYITAGTPVKVFDAEGTHLGELKARELSGRDDLLFLRNGLTGGVECRTNRSKIELNEALHAHN